MNGLDKIIEQIRSDAQSKADEIIKEARSKADEIEKAAENDAAEKKKESDLRVNAMRHARQQTAGSSAELKRRQALLAAKQDIISEVLHKAYEKVLAMDTDEYFEILERLLERSVQSKDGELRLSSKDLKRVPGSFREAVKKAAEERNAKLQISEEPAEIDGGFVLVYGGIEENCTVKAVFREEHEKLTDVISSYLFG